MDEKERNENIEHQQELLRVLRRQLKDLEIQKAKYGTLDVPPRTDGQIRELAEQIHEHEEELARLKKIVPEVEIPPGKRTPPQPETPPTKGKVDKLLHGEQTMQGKLLLFTSFILGLLVAACACSVFTFVAAKSYPEQVMQLLDKTPEEKAVAVHVADSATRVAVPGANVKLFFEGGTLSKYTDANGSANFNFSTSDKIEARIIVETDTYEIYEREVQLPQVKTVDIHLEQRDDKLESIIVRVVDVLNGLPIGGAKVLLLVEGEVHNQLTDSNGIAKFSFTFSESTIGAQVSVNTPNYQIDYQTITLMPNKVLDIGLNSLTGQFVYGPITKISLDGPGLDITPNPLPITSSTDIKNISAELIELSRFSKTVTAKVIYTNSDGEDQKVWVTYGSYLLDEATGKKYHVTDQQTSLTMVIPANDSVEVWAKFGTAEEEIPEIVTVVFPNGILFGQVKIE